MWKWSGPDADEEIMTETLINNMFLMRSLWSSSQVPLGETWPSAERKQISQISCHLGQNYIQCVIYIPSHCHHVQFYSNKNSKHSNYIQNVQRRQNN